MQDPTKTMMASDVHRALRESGVFEKPGTPSLTDEEEREILSARAELASRRCDSQRLASILETLFLKDAAWTPAELNLRLDVEGAIARHAAAKAA